MSGNIQIHLRIRPTAKPSASFVCEEEEGKVEFEMEKTGNDGILNNAQTKYKFQFDSILNMRTTQEEVFNRIARPVVDDALTGVNGTIFAYGQTGSGKTFTITGGTDRYVDRGLIPRTISHIFDAMKKEQKSTFRMFISYLEIYNEHGYDLLSREDNATKIEQLPKVILREDEDGNTHLKNLSVNMAGTEEDALNLLFLGDTNRVVAETAMNDASTRSHCIFIIWLESTSNGSDTVRRSKIHLVDLAGSERCSKTNIQGKLLTEAKFINVSLLYLEQVIVALHERSKGGKAHVHIPYRNSMMTGILRDSLGGNCKTIMVAAAAVESSNVDEAISTCRFAQRVALIKNSAVVNEEQDPKLIIRRLKQEIVVLKERCRVAEGEDADEELTPEIEEELRKKMKQWLSEDGPIVCGGFSRTVACCSILKDMVNERPDAVEGKEGGGGGGGQKGGASSEEVEKLKLALAQRDNEISILVQMINKKGEGAPISAGAPIPGVTATGAPPAGAGTDADRRVASPSRAQAPAAPAAPPKPKLAAPVPQGTDAVALLLDRNRAFEVFRKSVRRSETFDENIALMKKYYAEAKVLGEEGNTARQGINTLKKKVEQLRMERAMTAQGDEDFSQQADPEEEAVLKEMEGHKEVYTRATNALRKVKGDIERIQNMLEQNKKRLQKDFELWFHTLRMEASQGLQETKEEMAKAKTPTASAGKTPISATTKSITLDTGAPKTGDASVDNDIAEYYAALQNIRK